MERESHILKKEMQELPKMPRELIERFTKETHLNFRCKSDRREAYLLSFLVIIIIIIIIIVIIIIIIISIIIKAIII